MQDVAGGGDDEFDLEDLYHDPDIMECFSVIKQEIEYLGKMVQQIKNRDEKEFYSDKIEGLKYKQSTIKQNIDIGILTPESYIAGVRAYQEKTSKLFKEATDQLGKENKHVQRLENRLKIMKKEILEAEEGESARV